MTSIAMILLLALGAGVATFGVGSGGSGSSSYTYSYEPISTTSYKSSSLTGDENYLQTSRDNHLNDHLSNHLKDFLTFFVANEEEQSNGFNLINWKEAFRQTFEHNKITKLDETENEYYESLFSRPEEQGLAERLSEKNCEDLGIELGKLISLYQSDAETCIFTNNARRRALQKLRALRGLIAELSHLYCNNETPPHFGDNFFYRDIAFHGTKIADFFNTLSDLAIARHYDKLGSYSWVTTLERFSDRKYIFSDAPNVAFRIFSPDERRSIEKLGDNIDWDGFVTQFSRLRNQLQDDLARSMIYDEKLMLFSKLKSLKELASELKKLVLEDKHPITMKNSLDFYHQIDFDISSPMNDIYMYDRDTNTVHITFDRNNQNNNENNNDNQQDSDVALGWEDQFKQIAELKWTNTAYEANDEDNDPKVEFVFDETEQKMLMELSKIQDFYGLRESFRRYIDSLRELFTVVSETYTTRRRAIKKMRCLEKLMKKLDILTADGRSPYDDGNRRLYSQSIKEELNSSIFDKLYLEWRNVFTQRTITVPVRDENDYDDDLTEKKEIPELEVLEGAGVLEELETKTRAKDLNAAITSYANQFKNNVQDTDLDREDRELALKKLLGLKKLCDVLNSLTAESKQPWDNKFNFYVDIRDAIECLKANAADQVANADIEIPAGKEWVKLLQECADRKLEDGTELFNLEQRDEINEIGSESDAKAAGNKLQARLQQILVKNTGQENRAKQFKTLFDLVTSLRNYNPSEANNEDNNNNNNNNNEEWKEYVRECVNTEFNNAKLFSDVQQRRITEMLSTKNSRNIIGSIIDENDMLYAGYNPDKKRDALLKLVEKIETFNNNEAIKQRSAEVVAIKPHTVNPDLNITDAERVRKRNGIDANSVDGKQLIDAMNDLDSLEVEIGCTLKDLKNSAELQLIETKLSNLKKRYANKTLNKQTPETNVQLRYDKAKLARHYAKYFETSDDNGVSPNSLAVGRFYSIIKLLLNAGKSEKLNLYFNSVYGQNDASTISSIIEKFPNITELVSGWLALDKKQSFKPTTVDIIGKYEETDEDNRRSLDKRIATYFFEKNHHALENKQEEEVLSYILKKQQISDNNEPNNFIEFWRDRNKELFFLHEQCDNNDFDILQNYKFKEVIKRSYGVVVLGQLLNELNNLQEAISENSNENQVYKTVYKSVTKYLLNTWAIGLGTIYRGQDAKDAIQIDSDYNSFGRMIKKVFKSKNLDDLDPQIRVSIYSYLRSFDFSTKRAEQLENALSSTYDAYVKWANNKGIQPESIATWLKLEGIKLPVDKEATALIEHANSIRNSDDAETGFDKECEKLISKFNGLKLGYEKVKEDGNFPAEQNPQQNQGEEQVNQQEQQENAVLPEWKNIFTEMLKSTTTDEENNELVVFKRNDPQLANVFQNLIDVWSETTDCSVIDSELHSIYQQSKRNMTTPWSSPNEKKIAKARVEGIETIVTKIYNMIRKGKAPQGFNEKPDTTIWVHLEDNKEQNVINTENWDEVSIPKDATNWEKLFYETFQTTDKNGGHVFDLKNVYDKRLIEVCPYIRNSNELYDALLMIYVRHDDLSQEHEDIRKDKLSELVENLVEQYQKDLEPTTFEDELTIEKWENPNNIGQLNENDNQHDNSIIDHEARAAQEQFVLTGGENPVPTNGDSHWQNQNMADFMTDEELAELLNNNPDQFANMFN